MAEVVSMIELLMFSLLGVCLGIASGLVPGLHVNTLIPIVLSFAFIAGDPYLAAALLISTAIAQIFAGFIPSIFLGAPEENTALSVLPGHKMLLEGRGLEALNLTIVGSIGALVVSLVMMFSFANYFDDLYSSIRPYLHYILFAILVGMIVMEKVPRKIFYASIVVMLSGSLGFLVLNSSLIPSQNALFPLLSGLFGMSILITSIASKSELPPQSSDTIFKITKMKIVKSFALGSVAGLIVGFIPAVGVSQAAAAFQYIGGLNEARTFLVSLAGINVANEIFSLTSLYFIDNPRSGLSVAIGKIFGTIDFNDLLFFVSIITFASGLGAIATFYLGRKIPSLLLKIDYKKLSIGIVCFLGFMMFFLGGAYGFLVGFVATSIGLLCNYLGVRRSTCMAVLLLPTVSFFAGLNPLIISILSL